MDFRACRAWHPIARIVAMVAGITLVAGPVAASDRFGSPPSVIANGQVYTSEEG